MNTGTILDQITAAKHKRIDERLKHTPRSILERRAVNAKTEVPSFKQAISGTQRLSVIAEIKKASPSKGLIQPDFHAARQAAAYERAGASAISVLTEEDYFLGSDEYLKEAGKASNLPLLRKDFIIDEMQIFEAKLLGASAILLIAAMLEKQMLHTFYQTASALGLDALVEVHQEQELELAMAVDAQIIGVNNRDLKTFAVDLGVTQRLAGLLPQNVVRVAESGIHTAQDMQMVRKAGVDAVLIGESLMRTQGNAEKKLRELMEAADG